VISANGKNPAMALAPSVSRPALQPGCMVRTAVPGRHRGQQVFALSLTTLAVDTNRAHSRSADARTWLCARGSKGLEACGRGAVTRTFDTWLSSALTPRQKPTWSLTRAAASSPALYALSLAPRESAEFTSVTRQAEAELHDSISSPG
jgi:hypothetical protein